MSLRFVKVNFQLYVAHLRDGMFVRINPAFSSERGKMYTHKTQECVFTFSTVLLKYDEIFTFPGENSATIDSLLKDL